MNAPPRPTRPAPRSRLRALLAGLVLLGAVGSCDLPKPKLPSIGIAPAGPPTVVRG